MGFKLLSTLHSNSGFETRFAPSTGNVRVRCWGAKRISTHDVCRHLTKRGDVIMCAFTGLESSWQCPAARATARNSLESLALLPVDCLLHTAPAIGSGRARREQLQHVLSPCQRERPAWIQCTAWHGMTTTAHVNVALMLAQDVCLVCATKYHTIPYHTSAVLYTAKVHCRWI